VRPVNRLLSIINVGDIKAFMFFKIKNIARIKNIKNMFFYEKLKNIKNVFIIYA